MSSDRAAAKRILFLGFSAQPGGAELQMLSLIDSLDSARFHAIVVLSEEGALARMLRDGKHPVVIVPSMRALLRGAPDLRTLVSNAAAFVPTIATLRRLVVEHSIDLIHAYAEQTIKYAAVLRLLSRRQTFCTFLEVKLPRRNWIHGAGLRAAITHGIDTVISPSHSAAAGLIEARIAASKLTVVHHGVDVARFAVTQEIRRSARRRFRIGDDQTLIILAARFTRMKGHDVFLKALAILRDRGYPTEAIISGEPLFAGEHRWFCEIGHLLLALGLQDQVKLAGWLDDLVPLYAASDIVVHPCTLPDTLPLAVIEAMAASRPVIASLIGGLPELVVNDHTGLLVAPGDHVALAAAIQELIDQPERAKQLGLNARRRAVESFSQDRYAARIMDLYDRHLYSTNCS